MSVVIFHNPACGTSRNTLAIIRVSGVEPSVIEYLQAGWTEHLLRTLMSEAGAAPRDFLREKGTPAEALGLLDEGVSDDALIAAMVAHPILVNRPIVATAKGVKLCRPSEAVLDLLDNPPESFSKEDGEVVRQGQ